MMTKESSSAIRKCSFCGHNGHNSRTCKGCSSIKLFGVEINVVSYENHHSNGSIRRTKSLGSLQQALKSPVHGDSGYLSDDLAHSSRGKKKGTSWTEEEHRGFLFGLERLGKGDWRGISRCYVPSRTPTQVASHAQKYFIRMSYGDRKKRRTSVFDLDLHEMNQQNAPAQDMAPSEFNVYQDPAVLLASSSSRSRAASPMAVEAAPVVRNLPAHNSIHYRPPLAPVPPPVLSGFNGMQIMNHQASNVMPSLAWGAPMITYNNQSYGYFGNANGNYASWHPIIPPPPLPPPAAGGVPPSAGPLGPAQED